MEGRPWIDPKFVSGFLLKPRGEKWLVVLGMKGALSQGNLRHTIAVSLQT